MKGEDIREFPLTVPMARPVAIIRSSDLSMVNSPPTPITPPTSISSPHQDHQEAQQQHMSDINNSPPESPQAQMERKGLSRISSPYATTRDYAFNHFHGQQTQVKENVKFILIWNAKNIFCSFLVILRQFQRCRV